MFFNFQVTVEENTEIERIELISPIREVITHGIVIENPTDLDVQVTKQQFIYVNEYIEILPDNLTLKAHEAREFTVRYLPLMVSESECDLTLK